MKILKSAIWVFLCILTLTCLIGVIVYLKAINFHVDKHSLINIIEGVSIIVSLVIVIILVLVFTVISTVKLIEDLK